MKQTLLIKKVYKQEVRIVKAIVEIINFDVADIITTSAPSWDDGNTTPPTVED